jgi:hypothetical protein
MRRRLTALLLAATVGIPLAAQEPVNELEPEAPATLLPFKIGDAGAEISVAGSWSALVSFGAGLLFAPGEPVRGLDSLPGIVPGVAFSQVPDLSLSITLLERWFIDISVLEGLAGAPLGMSSLLMGYRGDGIAPVRHVLLGTAGVTAKPAPFLEIPNQADGTLGVSALVVSGLGTNEALLRWEPTGQQSRLYLGSNELLEERIGLDAWLRGTVLVLPDTDVDDLVILIEDPEGTYADSPPDGRTYRPAGLADAVIDSTSGIVIMKAESKGRVLAYYTKNGMAVGTDDLTLGVDALPGETGGRRDLEAAKVRFYFNMPDYLGDDMNRRQITITGIGDCLLLWEPGDPSPFQLANTYAFAIAAPADASRVRAFLEKKTTTTPPNMQFEVNTSLKVVALTINNDLRDFHNWYPFWEAPEDAPINLLYGPERDALEGLLEYELVVQALQPVDGYVLGTDVVPGSIHATVNGVEERRFTFDRSSGRLTFQVEMAPTDRIEVRWRTEGAGAEGGDVLLTWRDDVRLAENLDFHAAAGLRWNVGTGLTAGEPYARSGAVVAEAGLEGSMGALDWSVDAAASFANPDTTGVVRLHGMEGHSIEVDLSEELAYPAAPPVKPAAPPPEWYSVDPVQGNRGKLFYRDYRSYDVFGGAQLHDITWTTSTVVPYENGGRPGPYNVLGTIDDSSSGKSLVLEYDLPNTGEWVGTQLPVVAGTFVDLSTAKSITVRMKGLDLAGSAQVHLEIGAIGEDLDGDGGVPDHEDSTTQAGFSFNDDANAVVLNVGCGPKPDEGNRFLDSEDRDGSGTLTPEDVNGVVPWFGSAPWAGLPTWPVTPVTTSRTEVTFSLDDAARARLQQTRTIRIIVEGLADGTTGRIQIDRISIAGSGYWAAPVSGAVTAQEIAEELSTNDPGDHNRLSDVQPEAMKLFHPAGEQQEVLEVEWAGTSTDITVTGFTPKKTGGITYDTAVLYVRAKGIVVPTTGSIGFELLDSAGNGISWTLDPAYLPDDAWHELAVSRTEGTVRLDGGPSLGTPTFDASHGELSLLTIVVSGSTDGLLVFDEVHLRDPQTAWGAALRAEASWSRSGVIWSAGSVPLIANASARQEVSLTSAGFTSLYGTPAAESDITSRTEFGADILYARLRADLVLRAVGSGFVGSGGHRITIPAAPSPVTFSDAFSLTGTGEFSREDSLRLRPVAALDVSLDAKADGTAEVLQQEWAASVEAAPLDGLRLGLDLAFSQAATGYTLPDGWYGARWAKEMALLAPWYDETPVERAEGLSTDITAQIRSVDASLSIDAATTATGFTSSSRDQEDTVDVTWSLAWPAGRAVGDGPSVALNYARSLSLAGERSAGDPFSAEAVDFFSRLGGQRYYLLGLPVLEILLDDTDEILATWSGVEHAEWNPTLSISVARRFGSRLSDLFVPATAELTVSRRLERHADLAENEILVKPRLVSRALNLFGRLGSHPLLPFYRTDEFSIALSGTVCGSTAGSLSLSELTLETAADILGFQEQSLLLVNVFTLGSGARSVTDGLEATFDWTTHPPRGVRLPYLPEAVAATGYVEHRESLDLDVRLGSTPSHPVTLVLGHATRLVYPDRGSIEACLKTGFDLESLSGSFACRFAIETSLEAKLSF